VKGLSIPEIQPKVACGTTPNCLNLLVSFGIRLLRCFCDSYPWSSRSCFSPSYSCLDSLFWDRFDSFLLHWIDLWCELSLSTEGNQPIPHELIDRDESSFRGEKPVFLAFFRFPVVWLQIGQWSLRDSSPTALWSCSQNLVAVGVDLATKSKDRRWRRLEIAYFLLSARFTDSPCLIRGQSANRGSSGAEINCSFWVFFWFLNCG